MSEARPWPAGVVSRLDGPAGAPVVLLGNSLGTTAAVWAGQVPDLRESFRLLSFELPGHGGAPQWPGPYTVGELGAGLLAMLDSYGIERAGYCGISLGGMLGMWLAAHAPARIAALGLVCTSAYLPPAQGWHERAAKVRAAGLASISAQVVARWFTPAYAEREPHVVAEFTTALEATSPEGYAGCCEAIAGMDLRADLAAITAPTLVIAGAEDPATPPRHGEAIADGIGGVRLEVITGAAHLAAVSAPEIVTSALLQHLGAVARADPTWRSER
ncbi:MAG TPA: 3-oxoadipate enol-lactonase [Streptosporangiaceae bacterium]|nr:3-oxoadipate enol-lactonase [Streptosporangiaceae bacterium]